MSEGSIKVPTWALPIGAALVSGAIAWGSMQAQAAATQEEVAEIKVKVEQADTTGKLNAQAIEQITQYRSERCRENTRTKMQPTNKNAEILVPGL